MNLADAIRMASHTPVAPKPAQTPAFTQGVVEHHVSPFQPESSSETTEGLAEAIVMELPGLIEPRHTDEHEGVDMSSFPTSASAGMIRLELYLPPEQLQRLIRSVVASQHSVLTLREAASHLRVPQSRLEEMAEQQLVPAFKVDGKWRFSRARLEEWTTENKWDKEQIS
ncbi:MAG TPA: helix-turn-helix domain-containing protein [Fimbriimonas sp.]|nr:helix-turn-helix domain-containing protein [Fimbriimonas sp.]